jgi:transposase
MRYSDGGGVGPQARARREQLRRQAAAMFAEGIDPRQVSAALQVSTKSAYTWRRAWAAGGEQALASKGPSGPDRVLSEAQVAKLVTKLQQGPAAAGWVEDQRWTLSRVRTLIGRRGSGRPNHGGDLRRALGDDGVCCFDWRTSA